MHLFKNLSLMVFLGLSPLTLAGESQTEPMPQTGKAPLEDPIAGQQNEQDEAAQEQGEMDLANLLTPMTDEEVEFIERNPDPWNPGRPGRNVVRYRVNQTQGPYAPSCNGNPVYPQPDRRCCQFGYNALCFTYTVGCNFGERLVRANLRCQGYTNSSYAMPVRGYGWGGRNQYACQKYDGSRGYVTLSGFITCQRGRR